MVVPRIFLGMLVNTGTPGEVGTVIGYDDKSRKFMYNVNIGVNCGWQSMDHYSPKPNRENFLKAVDEWKQPHQSDLELLSEEEVATVLEEYEPYKAALKEMFRALPPDDKYFFAKLVDVVTTSVPK